MWLLPAGWRRGWAVSCKAEKEGSAFPCCNGSGQSTTWTETSPHLPGLTGQGPPQARRGTSHGQARNGWTWERRHHVLEWGEGRSCQSGENKKIKFVKLKDNYNYWKLFWRFWDIITWKVRLNSSESLLLPCISEFKFTCAWLGFRSPI